MMKYTNMKRLTQLLASILFIISVLTVYLAFDFVVNNAISKTSSTKKHDHIHNDKKLKKPPSSLSLLQMKKMNQTLKKNDIIDEEHDKHSVKRKLGKPAQFHKSKTGVKINQIKKTVKEQRKHSSTPKIIQRKSKFDESHI